ncbi:DUF192 domain-containing protein [Paraurantiacibacter namhicola]|uniref:DUF192 domain-containing protein n=1 Tax=Paraurantiacibacter namhicola TaxID=645517 RepID=A0A1C7D6L6_9SPHN|nr:DUF192 domain-containing protein [Paraurantiacibacter namhicola]ANU07098.1 hypothetical protein A6F65_00779 [Paraurantiacibacter namhicola]
MLSFITRRFLAAPLAAMALLAMPACNAQGSSNAAPAETPSAPQRHPVSGLEVIPVTVTADGQEHVFMAEVARTPEQQAQGMMYREEMGPMEAMIFPRPQPRIASFWMKNTPLPLDLIFIGADGKVINVGYGEPYSEGRILSDAPAAAVLEVNAGVAEQLGIGPGASVRW